jgi:hypothetical protein
VASNDGPVAYDGSPPAQQTPWGGMQWVPPSWPVAETSPSAAAWPSVAASQLAGDATGVWFGAVATTTADGVPIAAGSGAGRVSSWT